MSAVPSEPRTVLEAVQLLESEGFTASILLTADGFTCSSCSQTHTVEQAEVERVYRFEGPSDPDEEAVVYALRCGVCGAGGVIVSSFGPGADPELTDRLIMLESRFRHR